MCNKSNSTKCTTIHSLLRQRHVIGMHAGCQRCDTDRHVRGRSPVPSWWVTHLLTRSAHRRLPSLVSVNRVHSAVLHIQEGTKHSPAGIQLVVESSQNICIMIMVGACQSMLNGVHTYLLHQTTEPTRQVLQPPYVHTYTHTYVCIYIHANTQLYLLY